MEEEGTLVGEVGPKGDANSLELYSLHFKGLIKEETTGLLAGFGVAIFRQEDDNLLFQMKKSLHDSAITVLEAELIALKLGLTEAVNLGISRILIFCDHSQIFELVIGRCAPEKDNIALLLDDVQHIRQQLKSSIPALVTASRTSFAYKLAMETLVSEISIRMPGTCGICFDDDIEPEKMFSVFYCGHQFCVQCLIRHIEVGVRDKSVIRCPHDGCKSNLTLRSCANLLTPTLREMWGRRIKEDSSIPVWDRVYCPKEKCSALMSKTELLPLVLTEEGGVRACCLKCGKPFCIKCRVPWHSNLSCKDYNRLSPNPTAMWRQCKRCRHMLALPEPEGSIRVVCRCGYSFCYECGADWNGEGCTHCQMEKDGWIPLLYPACIFVGLIMFFLRWILGYQDI